MDSGWIKLAQIIAESDARLTRKLETLLDINANSEGRLRQVEESFALLVQMSKIADDRLDHLDKSQARLSDDLNESQNQLKDALFESETRVNNKIQRLLETQANSQERLRRVEESFVLLVQMARIADERLDVLTDSHTQLKDQISKRDS